MIDLAEEARQLNYALTDLYAARNLIHPGHRLHPRDRAVASDRLDRTINRLTGTKNRLLDMAGRTEDSL